MWAAEGPPGLGGTDEITKYTWEQPEHERVEGNVGHREEVEVAPAEQGQANPEGSIRKCIGGNEQSWGRRSPRAASAGASETARISGI